MNLYREMFSHIRSFSSSFWIVIIATLMNQIGNMAFVFLVLYLYKYLGFSLTEASFGFAAFSAAMLLSGLFGGNIIDRLGALRMLIGVLFVNGVILLIFPLVHHYFSIILMCIIWGCTYGLYKPASQTLISYISTPGLHKITFSVYRLALNLGMSIGPAVGGYLATRSFAFIFIVNGIANLLACAILIAGLIRSSWLNHRPALQRKMELTLKWLKKDVTLRIFFLGMLPISMVYVQHESTLPIFLNHDLGFSLGFYGLLFTLNTLLIVFLELLLNIAMINWPYRVNFMLGSLLITAGFAGMFYAREQWHIILLTILWTLGEMILYPSASSYIVEIAPESHRGSYMSLYSTCSNLGMLLGPWSGALVMQKFGAGGLWIACGLFGVLSVISFVYTRIPVDWGIDLQQNPRSV